MVDVVNNFIRGEVERWLLFDDFDAAIDNSINDDGGDEEDRVTGFR